MKPSEEIIKELTASLHKERFWAEIVKNASVGIATGYPDGRLGNCNTAYQKITGYSEKELKTIDWNKVLTPPEWEESETAKLQELHRTKKSVQYEKEYIKKDGSRIPVELLVHPRFDSDGNVEYYFAFVIDITERKQADEELKTFNLQLQESEKQLKANEAELKNLSARHEAILTAVPDIIMEVNNNKIYTWANAAGYDFFGDDVIGKEAAFYFEGEQDTYNQVKPIFNGKSEDVIFVESWQRRKDGKKRLLSWWCRMLKDADGNIRGALSSARDITEERLAQKELKDSQSLYHDLVETAQDLIWQCDAEGRYTYLNPAWEEVFGYKLDEMLGRKFTDFQTEEAAERDMKVFAKLMKGNIIKGLESVHLNKNNEEIHLIFNAKHVLDDKGDIIGTRGTAFDVSNIKKMEEELSERESQYTALFNSMNEGLVLHEMIYNENGKAVDYRILEANPIFELHTGIEPAKCRNKLASEFYGTESAPYLDVYAQVAETGTSTHFDTYFPPMEKHFDISVFSPQKGKFATVFTDISERKRFEKKLQKSEEQFRNILDSTPFPIAVVDLNDDQIFFWSKSAHDLFGHTASTTNKWYEIAYPDPEYRQQVVECWKPFLEEAQKMEKTVNTGEYNVTCKDGSIRICELYATFHDEYLIVTFNDITERKKAEEEAFAFREFMNSVPGYGFAKDIDLKYVTANRTFCDLLKIPYGQIKEKTDFDIFPADLAKKYIKDDKHVIETGESIIVEEETIDANTNKLFVVETRKYPWYDNEGNIIGIYGMGFDITDRKKAEKEIKKLNDELEKRVIQRTAQFEEANKELESFVYSVSHDLRAPLRSIMGFAQIIAKRYKENLNEEGQKYFGYILEASNNMANLIEDLLQFSRLARTGIEKEQLDLNEVMDSVKQNLHQDITENKAKIILPEKMPIVKGDQSLLMQIFTNLIQNAIVYHRKGVDPEIVVTIKETPKNMIIKIADNGQGIPEQHHEKIFNIFQRLHSSDDYPGTGIGLSIVKKAVNALGGSISLESQVDEGTSFSIILPKQKKGDR
ncbi:MAG: PAS domain S-box protein [Bacteroidetes bacterium]|nr:PAS domain S-box protein [Bacteroidota bacterium]